jgi:hypothetical protein
MMKRGWLGAKERWAEPAGVHKTSATGSIAIACPVMRNPSPDYTKFYTGRPGLRGKVWGVRWKSGSVKASLVGARFLIVASVQGASTLWIARESFEAQPSGDESTGRLYNFLPLPIEVPSAVPSRRSLGSAFPASPRIPSTPDRK